MITRTNIEEANRHLKALHQKIIDLEMLVKDQHEALVSKDSFIQTKIQELKSQDLVIKELRERLEMEKVESGRLEYKMLEQETELKRLRRSNAMFAEVLKFLPEMKSLMGLMDKAVSSQAVMAEVTAEEADTSQCNTSSLSAADGDVVEDEDSGERPSAGCSPSASFNTSEMAEGFNQPHRQKQFIMSEDDSTDSVSNGSPGTAGTEFYL